MRGQLIALSGIDGAGKTTLAGALGAAMSRAGWDVAELSMGPSRAWEWAQSISACGLAPGFDGAELSLALNFERFGFVTDHVVPHLRRHDFVILQRYVLDWGAVGQAYGATAREWQILSAFLEHVDVPTLPVLIEVDPTVAAERIAARGGVPDDRESMGNLVKMANAYSALADEMTGVLRLDGAAPTSEHVELVLERLRVASR